MHVPWHHVVSDMTGGTGMQSLRAMVAGRPDPATVAASRNVRCKASVATVRQALTGNDRPEHVCARRQALELDDSSQVQVAEWAYAMEAVLASLEQAAPETTLPAARHKTRAAHAPACNVRAAVCQLLGTDLTQLHGFGAYTALMLVGACGTDMTPWPTVNHCTSWLTVAPGNKISGGKLRRTNTRRAAKRAAKRLRIAAVNVGKTPTALGAFSRRLAARVGKAKAVTATARKLAGLFDNPLRYGMAYQDPGAAYDEEQYRQRVLKSLRRRATEVGYELQETTAVVGVS
jgi:transposase